MHQDLQHPRTTLGQRLRFIARDAASLVSHHLQLAKLEAREAVSQGLRLVLFGFLALEIAVFSFILLNFALIAFLAHVMGGWAVPLLCFGFFYTLVAVGIGYYLFHWWNNLPSTFSQTGNELSKTREWLSHIWDQTTPPEK